MASALRIGELASAANVTTDAVRYYERLKILPRRGRTRAGYRLYSEEDVERLRFIKEARSLGLSLDEVKELLLRLFLRRVFGRKPQPSDCGSSSRRKQTEFASDLS
jgi:DNA-binding transcriptional MerR regulator